MDSIPQDLIDSIIDNVPEPSLLSCSLVAKRWRQKSQRRAFDTISFSSEAEVNRWCADIPQDSDGIPSYVRHLKIEEIFSWDEPTLLSRILGSLSSLTTLSMYATGIPDEFPSHISRGEFGKGIVVLYLGFSCYTFAAMTSMILSLPSLKELCVDNCRVTSEGPLPTHSVAPQREPLDSLGLHGPGDGVGESLAKSRLTSSRLSLDVNVKDVEQLLSLSSETVVELKLHDYLDDGIPPPIQLPSLPALTTLVIHLDLYVPLPHLTNILCSIGSTPALTFIAIEHSDWEYIEQFLSEDPWVDMDRWLSRISKYAEVTGGLSLTLRRWPEGKSVWEGFLPEFRGSGGEIRVEYLYQ